MAVSTTIDRNGKALAEGDRVHMIGTVVLVNAGVVTVNWDHPEREVVGHVLSPGCLEVEEK